EFAIFEVKVVDGKLAGTVTSANEQVFGKTKESEGTLEGDRIEIRFPAPGSPISFKGVLDKDGKKARGMVKFRGTTYPGRIERTGAKEVARLGTSPLQRKLAETAAIKEPKKRIEGILGVIAENPGHPMNATAYAQALGLAEAAGLPPEEVVGLVRKWTEEAGAF